MNNELILTPVHGADRPYLPEHTISCAYHVRDQHGRRVGFIVRANYATQKRQSWFAILPNGQVSSFLYMTRAEAEDAMKVMWAGYLLCHNGGAVMPEDAAKVQYLQPIEMLTLSPEA